MKRYFLTAAVLLSAGLSACAPAAPAIHPATHTVPEIAFSSDRDGNTEIYVMKADGSGQTNLTHNPA